MRGGGSGRALVWVRAVEQKQRGPEDDASNRGVGLGTVCFPFHYPFSELLLIITILFLCFDLLKTNFLGYDWVYSKLKKQTQRSQALTSA